KTLGLWLRGRREHASRATAEVDDVDAALLGRVGDAMREVERLVEQTCRVGRRAAHRRDDRPLRARRDDRLGDAVNPDPGPRAVSASLRARRDDRLGDAVNPDPGPRAVSAQPFAERLERVDLVGADVLAEAEEDHPRRAVVHCNAERNASATRSWSSRARRAWNGIAIVRSLASSLTGQSPS